VAANETFAHEGSGDGVKDLGRLAEAVAVLVDMLSDLFVLRGVPAYVRSDNGPDFIAQALRDRRAAVGAKTAYTMPGSTWENGYCESFNSKLRD
jgi:transposase InsO family protein